eukprot:scaffold1278_cov59-Cyclotella_meneghiniana.AAC.10
MAPEIKPQKNLLPAGSERSLKHPRNQLDTVLKLSIETTSGKHKADSKYLEAEFYFIAAGYPGNQAVQELFRKYKDNEVDTKSADFIRERDGLIDSFLPALRDQGLVPKYESKYVRDLVIYFNQDTLVTSWWLDFSTTHQEAPKEPRQMHPTPSTTGKERSSTGKKSFVDLESYKDAYNS